MENVKEVMGEELYNAIVKNDVSDFFQEYNKEPIRVTNLIETIEVIKKKAKKCKGKGKKKTERELNKHILGFWQKMEHFQHLLNPTPQFIMFQLMLESHEIMCKYLGQESTAYGYMKRAFDEKGTTTKKLHTMEYKELKETLSIHIEEEKGRWLKPAFSPMWMEKIEDMKKWQLNYLYRTHKYNDVLMSPTRTTHFVNTFLDAQHETFKEEGQIPRIGIINLHQEIKKIYSRDVSYFSHLVSRYNVCCDLLEIVEEEFSENIDGRYTDKDIWYTKQTLGRMKTFLQFFATILKGVGEDD